MGWRKRTRKISVSYCVKCQIVGTMCMNLEDPCGTKCLSPTVGRSGRSRTARRCGGGNLRTWPRPAPTRAPPPAATRPPPPTRPPRPRSPTLWKDTPTTTTPRWTAARPPRRSVCRATSGRGATPTSPRTTWWRRSGRCRCRRGWSWSTIRWRTTARRTGGGGARTSTPAPPPPPPPRQSRPCSPALRCS